MNMNDKQQNNPAEIDLFYFFKPISNVLRKFGLGVRYYFMILKTNKLLFAGIVLVITLAGFSLRYIIPPAYQTEGIFGSHILPAKYCALLLNNLDKLKSKKNMPLLAHHLKISPDAADDILSLNLLTTEDTLESKYFTLFRINLIVNSMQNLDTIQWGLINYLENNEYAIKRKDAKRKALESLKATLNIKLESLDSLKKIVNNSIIPRSEGRGIIMGESIDPISVYQAEVAYYKEQLNIDQALATIDNIEIIQPFLKIIQYNYPRYNRMLLSFFFLSLIIAMLVTPFLGRKPK
jgi:hypothetical protein